MRTSQSREPCPSLAPACTKASALHHVAGADSLAIDPSYLSVEQVAALVAALLAPCHASGGGPRKAARPPRAQALAYYVALLAEVKASVHGARTSPVVAFGGSYGGMLSAWLRAKYPWAVAVRRAPQSPAPSARVHSSEHGHLSMANRPACTMRPAQGGSAVPAGRAGGVRPDRSLRVRPQPAGV